MISDIENIDNLVTSFELKVAYKIIIFPSIKIINTEQI